MLTARKTRSHVSRTFFSKAPPDKAPLIEREIRTTRAGIKGEQESAYLIDFHLRDSKNTAVIHDLRLELADGRVAQIDHLLIHRTYRFFILETKHFSHGVKITEQGEFLRWNDWKKTFEGMPSPLEQNVRHAAVLRKALLSAGLPEPNIESLILVAPSARIDRPKRFDTSKVVKADQFITALEKTLEGGSFMTVIGGLLKVARLDSIAEIAKKLIALHRPVEIDYRARFGIAETVTAPVTPAAPAVAAEPEMPPPKRPERPAATPSPAMPVAHACRSCGSTNLSVQYGKFGYYFKCGACDGNTPLKVDCGQPGHRERVRKDGVQFFRECAECGTSSLYFTNAAASR
ncbi:MAG TPA: nuclease-related domain-containing protein [Noviherbaspirillum sp.]|jgi:hypothetical protein|uniref:nuclease-related domain-containing protein n=1 Tax=Noviherbaspirillum sp. TaxID=1926288 RepID=UPI002F95E5D2